MSHLVSVKIPSPLHSRLDSVCRVSGKSKGAVVREALHLLLGQTNDEQARLEKIRQVTRAIVSGKKCRTTLNLKILRNKLSYSPTRLSPEDEVLEFRRRRL